MRISCFKHVPFEGPAAVADWAAARGHVLNSVELYSGQIPPEEDNYDMLLVMGGPMNIHEESEYPWIAGEKAAIGRAIESGKFVVGICLGAQLIADVLGAKVVRGKEVEIGWLPIQRSASCPSGIALPDTLRVYHWHGDTFDIPSGAVQIASSSACPNQGFLYEGRVLALQCHLETTRDSMNALIEACGHEIHAGHSIQDAKTMQSEPDATFETMQAVLFEMLDQMTRHA